METVTCPNHPDTNDGLRACGRCQRFFCSDCLVVLQGLPYCANCKVERVLDLRSGVDLTQLDLASNGRRFAALFIDSLIISTPMSVVVFAILGLSGMSRGFLGPQGYLFIIPALGYFVYEGAMLAYRGQTVGKIALKIRVVRTDGSPISKGQGWGRSLARTLLASCLSLFNYIPAFVTKERTCLHDMMAGTRVVNVE